MATMHSFDLRQRFKVVGLIGIEQRRGFRRWRQRNGNNCKKESLPDRVEVSERMLG
jgi:hypothetical protein